MRSKEKQRSKEGGDDQKQVPYLLCRGGAVIKEN